MKKTIFIPGGCGFVGSGLAIAFKKQYPDYDILVMDNLKRRGSELNIPRLTDVGVKFFHGDIRNKEDFEQLPAVDIVIDAAAEPSVMAGIGSGTDYLINTNFNGSINCLNFALQHKADFIFLSTSRVYPITSIENIRYQEAETRLVIDPQQPVPGISPKGIAEDYSLEGHRSLYGASKLATELFVTEYNKMLGLKTVINRCGVLTGPYQMGKVDQGVVVLWVARHFWKKKLSYIGYGGQGKQVRDILHINDLYKLIDYQVHNIDKVNGELYNVGGSNDISVSLKELTALCEQVTGNKIQIDSHPETRVADIPIYVTDNSKVTASTGWKPEIGPLQIITEVHDWIKANEKQLDPILNG